MNRLILASASPRRKELLSQVGVGFEVMPSEVDESNVELKGAPGEKAAELALLKAWDVAGKVGKGLVLGADTIVVLDDEIFGKPQSKEDAFRMLAGLSGRSHLVITGIALVNTENGLYRSAYETTVVEFAELDAEEIQAYINTGEPEGKAGAYAVQGIGALLVKKIDGCYSNVVGLPLMKLRRLMEEFGIKLL